MKKMMRQEKKKSRNKFQKNQVWDIDASGSKLGTEFTLVVIIVAGAMASL
jgi:hypothetical protein